MGGEAPESSDRMRAAVVDDEGRIGIDTLPRPPCPSGHVRVRVEACGVCGSDLHAARRGDWRPGLVPGHEIAGRIEILGDGVDSGGSGPPLSHEMPVVVEPLETCGDCPDCRAGHDSVCASLVIRGVHASGGFAESIVVPAVRVHPIAPQIEPGVATLIEPLAVALHALDRAAGVAGERVLVIGAGAIGLLCAFAARQAGAAEVRIRARYPHQAEHARALGVIPERANDSASASSDARGFDLVIETVGGAAETLVEAGEAIRPRGRIVVLGLFEGPPALDPMQALEKELTFLFSNCYQTGDANHPDFARAAELMAQHHERLAPIVTHRLALEEIRHAFTIAADKRAGVGKLVVVPSID
jgi:2-desacetyl-2-hydroxyethyl bacteriochlorophyllide A dehydrogenase